MNKTFKKATAFLMSLAMAFSLVPSSYAAVDSGNDTSYSVKQKTTLKSSSGGNSTYAAALRSDKVGNAAQTETVDGYDQQVETKLTEATDDLSATYFEQDKYISDPTGEKNGQSTYNITLENAYVGPQVLTSAPTGQDIIIVEDASSSMQGHTDTENDAVSRLLAKIHDVNLQRIENAMNGLYKASIDPTGKTEAQVQQEMIDGGYLLRVVGVTAYNESVSTKYSSKSYLLSSSDVTAVANAAKVSSSDLKDTTRTDYAMQNASNFISDASRTTVVLLTDGAPYDWNNSVANGYLMSSGASNSALDAANSLKAKGVTIYSMFLPWDATGDATMYEEAVKSNDITALMKNGKVDPDGNMAAVFLSLLSSDYASGHLNTQSGSHMFTNTFSYASNGNGFGMYSKYIWDTDTIVESIAAIANQIHTDTYALAQKTKGYANVDSYIIDDISNAFELDGLLEDIKVYQVPRVPADLDSTNHVKDASNVTSFTWGEKEDITDQLEISYENNRIKIKGYNYEANALTTYDHDLTLTEDQQGTDPEAYNTGDYGYKLVVEFPIRAKFSFGGNDIETNDSTTSGFYPSTPGTDSTLPKWTSNTSTNPDGNTYVALYPVPIVDLKVNYAINGSDQYIYAPQTAKVLNLVTNDTDAPANLSIFNTGDTQEEVEKYFDTRTEYRNAEAAYTAAQKAFNDAYSKYSVNTSDASLEQAMMDAQTAMYEAKDYLQKTEDAFTQLSAYIPDGTNNAYVDITYTLKSPSGEAIGTMNIPHGTALEDEVTNNTGNIKWTFTDGDDMQITEDGTYTITCTVTPVKTTRTETHTGSSDADDTLSAETYTKTPVAHLYQLQITMKDTAKKPGATLDFTNDGNENVLKAADSDNWDDIHWVEAKWVCIDGHTASDPDNEPGNAKTKVGSSPIGVISVGSTDNTAETDGTMYVSKDAADGTYIPARISVTREAGNINKDASITDQVTQVIMNMSDDDHVFGSYSSIVWKHECDVVDDCDDNELKEARAAIDNGATTGQNITRFLIHVNSEVLPDIQKTTSTPTILPGGDIKWNITVSNNNETDNADHKVTKGQVLDILPYNCDGRIRPSDNSEDGSSFGGNVYVKTLTVDCSSSATMLEAYTSGKAKMYYTTDTAVRTASRDDWYNGKNGVTWITVTATVNENTVSFVIPQNAVAIKTDSNLTWGESTSIDIVANIDDTNQQSSGDYYINEALIANSDESKASDPAETEVTTISIEGTVWYDTNYSGQIDASEDKVDGVVVTLYRTGTSEINGHITVGGVTLERAYNTKEELIPSQVTGEDGKYTFDNLADGTYYVVATMLPDDYWITTKQASGTDSELNSKAEETMPAGNTAWIKEITVSGANVTGQNIGLVTPKGELTIHKVLPNGLSYPASMTDEQKAEYSKGFVFNLTNQDTGITYTTMIQVSSDEAEQGVDAVVSDLPLGTYTLSEEPSLGYTLSNVYSEQSGVSYDSVSKEATVTITAGNNEVYAVVENQAKDPDPGVYPGETVVNHVGTATPIQLKVTYSHGDINDTSATSYTFTKDDFSDIQLWYDDGTYRSFTGTYRKNADGTVEKIGEETLSFDELTLFPATITNESNTSDSGGRVAVKVYITEKNKTLSDTFKMKVNLQPIYRFTVVFHSNGSSFGGAETNTVRFGYNDQTGKNYIISGNYQTPDVWSGKNFSGWNTQENGSGVNYDSITALDAIGAEKSSTNRIDLYAHWKVNVTLNANGGTLSGGTSSAETALTGLSTGDLAITYGSTVATSLKATRSGYGFLEWNTAADGTGISLENYGPITEPVTFYAVLVQNASFTTTGMHSYTVTMDGWYQLTAVGNGGAGGSQTYYGGSGGTATALVKLTKGTILYCGTGEWGYTGDYNYRWNGGGKGNGYGGYYAANGGGCSHIALNTNRGELLNYSSHRDEVIVVGGGGGAGTAYAHGGAGGASDSGNNGQFGRGSDGGGAGGGGGWYGGSAGSPSHGGSNYVNTSYTSQYSTVAGNGNAGCYVTFVSK